MPSSRSPVAVVWGWSLSCLVVLASVLPLAAAVWTRNTTVVSVPKGGRVPLPNTSYVARDWKVVVSGLEVKDDALGGGVILTQWRFFYQNTDSEPHHVAIAVECQEMSRKLVTRLTLSKTLKPTGKEEAFLEFASRIGTSEWKRTTIVRVTVDFLSGPNE